jgi:hypothetical protein
MNSYKSEVNPHFYNLMCQTKAFTIFVIKAIFFRDNLPIQGEFNISDHSKLCSKSFYFGIKRCCPCIWS